MDILDKNGRRRVALKATKMFLAWTFGLVGGILGLIWLCATFKWMPMVLTMLVGVGMLGAIWKMFYDQYLYDAEYEAMQDRWDEYEDDEEWDPYER